MLIQNANSVDLIQERMHKLQMLVLKKDLAQQQ